MQGHQLPTPDPWPPVVLPLGGLCLHVWRRLLLSRERTPGRCWPGSSWWSWLNRRLRAWCRVVWACWWRRRFCTPGHSSEEQSPQTWRSDWNDWRERGDREVTTPNINTCLHFQNEGTCFLNCLTHRCVNSRSPGGFYICFSLLFIIP